MRRLVGELRIERHVEQPAEAGRQRLRHRPDWRRIEDAVADHAQAAGPLGDEHAAVGHERDAPGVIEPLDGRDVQAAAARAEIPRAGAQRVGGRRTAPARRRGRCRGARGWGLLRHGSRARHEPHEHRHGGQPAGGRHLRRVLHEHEMDFTRCASSERGDRGSAPPSRRSRSRSASRARAAARGNPDPRSLPPRGRPPRRRDSRTAAAPPR